MPHGERPRGRLAYDDDCGFCTASARWLAARGGAVVPWQSLDLAAVGLTEEQVRAEAWWVVGERPVAGGAAAVAAGLRDCGPPWSLAGRLLQLPLARTVARPAYRWVARNRFRLPGGSGACRMP